MLPACHISNFVSFRKISNALGYSNPSIMNIYINRVQKYIKSMIKLNPFVTRLILGWGISSDHQKNSQVKIWAATATYLRSKGYIRSKFQSGKFGNLIADSELLQKSVKRKCLSFFDIPTRTWCNLTSKVVFGLNLLFCLKFCVF